MGIRDTKVKPTGTQDETQQKSICARAYDQLLTFWNRSQIGHRSEYSVERLLAFRDYYQRTSIAHAIAVCILTPIPALTVALLLDCIPLRPPSDDWRTNYPFWIRLFVATIFIGLGLAAQVREVLIPGTMSNAGAFVIATGTAITYIIMCMIIAAVWCFPIPFGYILLVGPYVTIFWVFTLSAIGPRVVIKSPVLRQQVKSLLLIVNAQGIVAIAYPLFTAIFYRLSRVEQAVFVFVMPLIRIGTKQIIAIAAEGLHEYVGPVAVFSVDVFNVFYVAICMQSAKSSVTMMLMIASDSFHVIVSLRNIFKHKGADPNNQDSSNNTNIDNYLHDLPEMVRTVFEIPGGLRTRVFAPFPLPLSNSSVAFISDIAKVNRDSRVYASSDAAVPIKADYQNTQQRDAPQQLNLPNDILIKQNQVAHATPATKLTSTFRYHEKLTPRTSSAAKKLLAILHLNSKTGLAKAMREASGQKDQEGAVREALQALFQSEYLLMTEYIECALPGLYSAYLATLYHLPAAPYYPQTASLTPEQLTRAVVSISVFAAVEFAAFVGLILLLRRKFGISPLYQLAFVLETQARTLQGHLFVWTIFILHLSLVHYGTQMRYASTFANALQCVLMFAVYLTAGVDFNIRF